MWILAIAAVVGTMLALRFVKGYRPLAGFTFLGQSTLPADIALRFDNVTVAGRRDNRVAWSLRAGKIQTNQMRSRLDFTGGVTATLIDAGKPRATLAAPQATYDMVGKVLVAAGQVNCRMYPTSAPAAHTPGNDLTIDAEQLVWAVGSQRVSCPGRVEAMAPGIDLRGGDLFVDLATGEKTLNNATADIVIGGDGGLSGIDDKAGPLSLKEYMP